MADFNRADQGRGTPVLRVRASFVPRTSGGLSNVASAVPDVVQQRRLDFSGQQNRVGSTPEQRAGSDPRYIRGVGVQSTRSKPMGLTPQADWSAGFLTPDDRAIRGAQIHDQLNQRPNLDPSNPFAEQDVANLAVVNHAAGTGTTVQTPYGPVSSTNGPTLSSAVAANPYALHDFSEEPSPIQGPNTFGGAVDPNSLQRSSNVSPDMRASDAARAAIYPTVKKPPIKTASVTPDKMDPYA